MVLLGRTPVDEAVTELESLLSNRLVDRQVEGNVLCMLAQLWAMGDHIEKARSYYKQGREILRDLGQGVLAASTGHDVARVELLGGDLSIAEREVRADYTFLEQVGERYFLSSMAALLARIVRDQGRYDEALALSQTAETMTTPDDTESQALWRSTRAPILARAGELKRAEELAREAVQLVDNGEALNTKADALVELAGVLRLAGKRSEAGAVIAEAIALYKEKGNIFAARRAEVLAKNVSDETT